MVLKTPDEVIKIAEAVNLIDEETLRKGYNMISTDDEDYAEFISEEDFEYTWGWFNSSKEFWKLAAKDKRYVLFTADQ